MVAAFNGTENTAASIKDLLARISMAPLVVGRGTRIWKNRDMSFLNAAAV